MKKLSEWFRIDGDNTLRLDYPLDKNSMVWDVGGYKGDFTQKIADKFGCYVTIYEPVSEFYEYLIKRFQHNKRICIIDAGLSDKYCTVNMCVNKDSSSTIKGEPNTRVHMHDIATIVNDVNRRGEYDEYSDIDLIKINIEGGEYALLNRLIDTGTIKDFKYIQVQFHNFVEDAEQKRNAIREKLSLTHKEMWNYKFVWESWERK